MGSNAASVSRHYTKSPAAVAAVAVAGIAADDVAAVAFVAVSVAVAAVAVVGGGEVSVQKLGMRFVVATDVAAAAVGRICCCCNHVFNQILLLLLLSVSVHHQPFCPSRGPKPVHSLKVKV